MVNPLLKSITQAFQGLCDLKPGATKRRRKSQYSLPMEDLEPRLLMTARVWDGGGGANHNWTNRFNWQGDVAPGRQ
jgi:hypothetical protein